jgi:hypothetical protein
VVVEIGVVAEVEDLVVLEEVVVVVVVPVVVGNYNKYINKTRGLMKIRPLVLFISIKNFYFLLPSFL